MSGSTIVRVGDVSEQIRGVTYSSSEALRTSAPTHLPILRANNITEHGLSFEDLIYVPRQRVSDRQLLQPGDVVIAASSGSLRMVGKAAPLHSSFRGSFGAFCKVLRPTRKVHPAYFAHYFRTDAYRKRVSSLAAGLNINNLRNEDLDELEFPLPPPHEQRRIATILDQVDDLRRKRGLALEKLRKIPSAIFHEMFGNLSIESTPSTLSSVINDDDRINYGVVQPGPDVPDGVPLVRVANIVNNDYRPDSLKRISATIESRYKRSRLRGDEILVACVGSIGGVSLASSGLSGMNIARAVARIPVDPKKANRVYIAEFLQLPHTQEYFASETRTVAQPTLNIKQLSETPIVNPPLDLQNRFANRIAVIRNIERLHVQSITQIEVLFASLQHRAFTGSLTPSCVEAALESI